jgi:hypothetical protein
VIGTDCIGSGKSNYHTITTTLSITIKDESSIHSHVEVYLIQYDMIELIRKL